MQNNDSKQKGFEKKSERLDIRVSHKKKMEFAEACADQGDTPSNAIRRFITSYIRRAKNDDLKAFLQKMKWKRSAGALTYFLVFQK